MFICFSWARWKIVILQVCGGAFGSTIEATQICVCLRRSPIWVLTGGMILISLLGSCFVVDPAVVVLGAPWAGSEHPELYQNSFCTTIKLAIRRQMAD